jgi:predicted DNA-binding transcriptional regulator AlpA
VLDRRQLETVLGLGKRDVALILERADFPEPVGLNGRGLSAYAEAAVYEWAETAGVALSSHGEQLKRTLAMRVAGRRQECGCERCREGT